jgi:hypothetical protein
VPAPVPPPPAAGTRIPIWLNRDDEPAAPPSGQLLTITFASLTAVTIAAGAAAGLLICYGLCRVALDQRRLAAWESAWAATGPRWTSRR